MNRLIIRYAGYSANKALVTVDGQKLKYDKTARVPLKRRSPR